MHIYYICTHTTYVHTSTHMHTYYICTHILHTHAHTCTQAHIQMHELATHVTSFSYIDSRQKVLVMVPCIEQMAH